MMPEPNSYRPLFEGASPDENARACLEIGLKMFDQQSRGAPAAIIIEPIISAGGVIVPPRSFMQGLRQAPDERGMMLMFDEAQTAFGRIGHKFAADYFDVIPDILSMSKTLGGGLPLAATATTAEIEQDCHEKGFTFYTSHVADPLPAHAGLAVLRTIVEEDLIARARTMGSYLGQQLEALQQKHEVIGDVRGEGLLIGVELVEDRHTKVAHHRLGAITTQRCFELGLSMNIRRRPERGAVWRIAPPLTVSTDEIDRAIAILDQALTESLDRLATNSG
jgi:2,2-dialkylglycine decarboxylase (pyruvate)